MFLDNLIYYTLFGVEKHVFKSFFNVFSILSRVVILAPYSSNLVARTVLSL